MMTQFIKIIHSLCCDHIYTGTIFLFIIPTEGILSELAKQANAMAINVYILPCNHTEAGDPECCCPPVYLKKCISLLIHLLHFSSYLVQYSLDF